MKVGNWFFGLFELLSSQKGDGIDTSVPVEDPVDTDSSSEGEEGEGSKKDDKEDTSPEGSDAGDDSGGKDREKYIPRERFDQVNAKAQKADKLVELGILEEGEDGELRINPKAIQPKEKKEDKSDKISRDSFRFKKEEIDEDSWPLVEKINKGFDYYENLAQRMAFMLGKLFSQTRIYDDYPEYLQKDSSLRKKATDIMKNDPEFKSKYRGDPESVYWAVKRAAELLENKQPGKKPMKKPKSKFITPKGDAGEAEVKRVDISSLSKEKLDELERKEHERLKTKR